MQEPSGFKRKLLNDLERVCTEAGGAVSTHEYDDRGEFASETVSQHFGGWTPALRKAGFEPQYLGARKPPKQDFLFVSENECRKMREKANGGMQFTAIASELNRHEETVGYHARGECGHQLEQEPVE